MGNGEGEQLDVKRKISFVLSEGRSCSRGRTFPSCPFERTNVSTVGRTLGVFPHTPRIIIYDSHAIRGDFLSFRSRSLIEWLENWRNIELREGGREGGREDPRRRQSPLPSPSPPHPPLCMAGALTALAASGFRPDHFRERRDGPSADCESAVTRTTRR